MKRTSARATTVAISFAVATAVAVGTTGPVWSAPSRPPITSPAEATATSGHGDSITLQLPEGLTPRRVSGRVTLSGSPTPHAVILVGGRQVRTVPARHVTRFSVPVSAGDLRGRTLEVSVELVGRRGAGGGCAPSPSSAQAVLSNVAASYTGTERAPTTVGSFFASTVDRVDVVVPTGAVDTELEAGLAAVGALGSRYPSPTRIDLLGSSSPLTHSGPGQRVVSLHLGTGPGTVTTSVHRGLSTLTVTADGQHLVAAARSLGSPALALAGGPAGSGLSLTSSSAVARGATRTLAQLGGEQLDLETDATPSSYLDILQDSFGGTLSDLHVHLQGVHTTVPDGVDAQLDGYVNNDLVASVPLDSGTDIDTDFTVPGADLSSDNGLVLELKAADATGCLPAIPIQARIDGALSTVRGDLGAPPSDDLQAFPQVLGGRLPIALADSGPVAVDSASAAAQVVVALQRAAVAPLAVSLVPASTLTDGSTSGLLVGAGTSESDQLHAPLRFAQARLLDAGGTQLSVSVPQAFAALESVSRNGHDVLVMGDWAPTPASGTALTSRLASWLADQGWGGIGHQSVVLADSSGAVTPLPSAEIVPQGAVTSDQQSFARWLVLGVGVLLLLLLVRAVMARRRRRVMALVAAQISDDDVRASD